MQLGLLVFILQVKTTLTVSFLQLEGQGDEPTISEMGTEDMCHQEFQQ